MVLPQQKCPRKLEPKYEDFARTARRAMSPFDWIAQNLGLVSLTVISVILTIYLGYSMIHPEHF
jgi:hypothetical protein